MILSTEGMEKTGKSTLLYTAPLPIVVISLDLGHDRALYGSGSKRHVEGLTIETIRYRAGERPPEPAGKDITVYVVPPPMQLGTDTHRGYLALWDYVFPLIQREIPRPGTLGIDTMTMLTRHRRDAHLEKNGRQQLLQIEYGKPDGDIRDIYTWAKSYEKNLIAVHHLRDHYGPQMKDGSVIQAPDGTYEVDGMRATNKFVDVVIRTEKRTTGIVGKLMVCGVNLGLEGMEIENPTWDGMVDLLSVGWNGEPFCRRGK